MTNELSIELVAVEILDGVTWGTSPVLPIKAKFRVEPPGITLTASYRIDVADPSNLLREPDMERVARELCRQARTDVRLLSGSLICSGDPERDVLLSERVQWAQGEQQDET